MSLPSFLFNADAYTGDTPHLTTEEHGGYLLLMLAYYRMEKPLPASDRALASICKMTPEQWTLCKPTLAAFFRQDGELWRHDRIEMEISNRNAAVERFRARASAGGKAKAEIKRASSTDVALPKPAESKLKLIPLSESPLNVARQASNPEPPELSPVDTNYQPPDHVREACLLDADASTLMVEIQKFIWYQQQNGALSADWNASFQIWWKRFVAHKPKPKPRIEVNSTSAEEGETVNWEWYVKRWLTNQSTWSRRAGPEPGQPGCRVPAAVFEKHGIDPATGLKAKEPTG